LSADGGWGTFDPLYVPAITRVRASLARPGLLYVGACTRGALETRAVLQAGGDDYLCSVSAFQAPPEGLEGAIAPVWTGQQPLTRSYRPVANGKRQLVAAGYERLESLTAGLGGAPLPWTARHHGKPRLT
jgi:hypothetical protein